MKIKIEKIAVDVWRKKRHIPIGDFCEALKKTKVGESFLIPTISSNYRNAISIAGYLMGVKFTVRKCDEGFRIGRVA